MLSYCLKCRENMQSKNPEVVKNVQCLIVRN